MYRLKSDPLSQNRGEVFAGGISDEVFDGNTCCAESTVARHNKSVVQYRKSAIVVCNFPAGTPRQTDILELRFYCILHRARFSCSTVPSQTHLHLTLKYLTGCASPWVMVMAGVTNPRLRRVTPASSERKRSRRERFSCQKFQSLRQFISRRKERIRASQRNGVKRLCNPQR